MIKWISALSERAPLTGPWRRPQLSSLRRVIFYGLGSDAFQLARPLLYMALIDRLMRTVSISSVVLLCALIALLSVAEALASASRDHLAARANADLALENQFSAWRTVIERPLLAGGGSHSAQIVDGLATIPLISAHQITLSIVRWNHLPVAVIMIAMLALISWPLAFAYIVSMPIMLLVIGIMGRKRASLLAQSYHVNGTYRVEATEAIIGREALLAFSSQPFGLERVWRAVTDVTASSYSTTREGAFIGTATTLAQNLLTTALLLGAAILVITGSLSLGALVAFEMISSQLRVKVRMLLSAGEIFSKVTAGERATSSLLGHDQLQSRVPSNSWAVALGNDGVLDIKIDSFTYPLGAQAVLQNLHLKIGRAERVRIAGGSGTGKTTLGRLVAGLFDPEAQAPTIVSPEGDDGRGHGVLYVPQEPLILAGSLLENVLLQNEDEIGDDDRSRAISALAKVGLTPAAIPILGEGGRNISGGQRQRVHLARAFLRRADVLVLDEPTRGLDAPIARQVLANLLQVHSKTTILIISHDPLIDEFTSRAIILDGFLTARVQQAA